MEFVPVPHDLDSEHLQLREGVEGVVNDSVRVGMARCIYAVLEQALDAVTGPKNRLERLAHLVLGAVQLTGLIEDGPGGLEVHAVLS